MAESVHRLQLGHSATSMIMFHFFIVVCSELSFRHREAGEGDRPKGGGGGAGVAADTTLETKRKPRCLRPFHHASHGPPSPLSRGRMKVISPARGWLPSTCA